MRRGTLLAWNQYIQFNLGFKAADATVKEDARQKIMFMDHRKQFIPYMLGFMRNCLANFQIQLYS